MIAVTVILDKAAQQRAFDGVLSRTKTISRAAMAQTADWWFADSVRRLEGYPGLRATAIAASLKTSHGADWASVGSTHPGAALFQYGGRVMAGKTVSPRTGAVTENLAIPVQSQVSLARMGLWPRHWLAPGDASVFTITASSGRKFLARKLGAPAKAYTRRTLGGKKSNPAAADESGKLELLYELVPEVTYRPHPYIVAGTELIDAFVGFYRQEAGVG